jgi:hypothetical protein
MLVRYHRNHRRQSLSNLASPDEVPVMQARFAAGTNPSWAEWRAWAIQLGFTPLDMTPTPLGIYEALRRYGPILYTGTWGNTFDGHVVVITGIDTENALLSVDDPLEAGAPVAKDMNTYFGQLSQTLWENPLFVYR